MARVEISTQGWGWVVLDGNPVSGALVQIKNTDGTNATHWSALTGGTSSTGTITTDAQGAIRRFIDPGIYDIEVNAVASGRVEATSGNPVKADLNQPGIIAPQSQVKAGLSATALVANQAYYCRFVPDEDMTATIIAFRVTTAASVNDACDVGIFDSSFNRLVSKGATSGLLNATGTKEPTITGTMLRAGRVYYAAFSVGAIGGTAAQLLYYNFVSGGASLLFAASGVNVDTHVTAAAHPLAATMAAPTGTFAVPLLAVRES